MNPTNDSVGNGGDRQAWWGSFQIPELEWCRWQISLLDFFVRRALNEWHFAWTYGDDPLNTRISYSIPAAEQPDLELTTQSRHVLTSNLDQLTVGLRLADRPIIARPEVPLFVPPGEHVVLYVSTTLWLQPSLGGHATLELPINRPSDTWFGPDTRSGELCYASLTRARTSDDTSLNYPHRAVTPVDVINHGTDALHIERIRVPVTLLSLYANPAGQFVTDTISLRRRETEDQATMEINARTDDLEGTLIRIAEPREQFEPGVIVQAFTRLFG